MTSEEIQVYINNKLNTDGFIINDSKEKKYPDLGIDMFNEIKVIYVSNKIYKSIGKKIVNISFSIDYTINHDDEDNTRGKTYKKQHYFLLNLNQFIKGWTYYHKLYRRESSGTIPIFFDENNKQISINRENQKYIVKLLNNVKKSGYEFETIQEDIINNVYSKYKMAVSIIERYYDQIWYNLKIHLITMKKDYETTKFKTEDCNCRKEMVPNFYAEAGKIMSYLINDLINDLDKVQPLLEKFDQNIDNYSSAKDIKEDYETYFEQYFDKYIINKENKDSLDLYERKRMKDYYKIIAKTLIEKKSKLNGQDSKLLQSILTEIQSDIQEYVIIDGEYGLKSKSEQIADDYMKLINIFINVSHIKPLGERITEYLLVEKIIRMAKDKELNKEYLIFHDFIASVKTYYLFVENKDVRTIHIKKKTNTDSLSDDEILTSIMNKKMINIIDNEYYLHLKQENLYKKIDRDSRRKMKNDILLNYIEKQYPYETDKKKEIRDKQFLIAVVNGMYIDRINVDLLLKILRNTSYKILVNMLEQLNIQQNTMSVSDIKMIEAEITKLIGSYDNINTIENPFIKANITDNRKKDLLKTILKVIPKKKQGLRIIYFLMRAPYFPEVRRKKTKHLSNKFVLNISKELIKTKGKVTFDIQEKYKPILIKKLRGTEDKRIIKMMEDVGIDEPYKLNENNFDKLIKKIQSQLNLNLISEEKLKKLKRIFTILEDEITITMTGNKIEINDKTKFKEILKNTSSDKLKTIYKDLGIVQEEISMEDIEPIIKEIRNKMRTKEIIGRFFTLNEISEILGIHAGAVNLDINKIYEHLNKETMKLRKNLNKKRRASEKYEKYGQL